MIVNLHLSLSLKIRKTKMHRRKQIDKFIFMENFNVTLSVSNRTGRQKNISRDTEGLNKLTDLT